MPLDALRDFVSAHRLSEQERAVLAHAIDGCSMKQAAARLGISNKTVESYWTRIYNKTNRRSQLEVIAKVVRWVSDSALRQP